MMMMIRPLQQRQNSQHLEEPHTFHFFFHPGSCLGSSIQGKNHLEIIFVINMMIMINIFGYFDDHDQYLSKLLSSERQEHPIGSSSSSS